MMKKTPLLKEVLKLLQESSKPLSVAEIQTLLAKNNLSANKTTLYRMLNRLCAEDIASALLIDPKVLYYELNTHAHHHFVCQSCDSINCITDSKLENYIHALEKTLEDKGMKIDECHFSFKGICSTCS